MSGTWDSNIAFNRPGVLIRNKLGSWVFFNILFIQSLIFTILGYISVNSEVAEMEGVNYTAEGYIAPAIFTVINAVLILSLIHI